MERSSDDHAWERNGTFAALSEAAQAVRKQVRAELLAEADRMREQGRYPYAGAWYTVGEITRIQRELTRRDKRLVIELAAWLGLGFAVVWGLYWLFLFLLVSG